MSDVVLDFEYNHSIQTVWEGLTDATILAEWIMPTNFKAEDGYEFDFFGEANEYWDGVIKGKVLKVKAPQQLVYSWISAGETTTISWTLTEKGPEQTSLHFEMDGFSEATKQRPGAIQGAVSSWTAFAKHLSNVLAA